MIRKQVYRVRHHGLVALSRIVFRIASQPECTKLGSPYGGWFIPMSLLNENSVCYLVGVGEDITFDLSLIEELGCEVWAYDPTPRAIKHVQKAAAEVKSFHFEPVGLWTEEATLKWYAPKNPDHVSHSVVNIQHTEDFFEADCLPLSAMMARNGHDHIDLLKMDIEGAEHAVLRSLLGSELRPTVLAVEFDQPWPWLEVRRSVELLAGAGYQLLRIDAWNYTFAFDRSRGVDSEARNGSTPSR